MLDAAGLGLHRVDLVTGLVCWASQAQLDLLGYDRDEYAGRPAADFHEDPAVGQDVLQRLRRGEPLRDREVDLAAQRRIDPGARQLRSLGREPGQL